MKTKNYLVSIPEPCHEDWNRMLPDEKGRFCNSCNKPVYDFTAKSDAEVHDILSKHNDEKICGRFLTMQLNRPLDIKVPVHLLPSNVSPSRAFAMALFLVFGTTLFSCTSEKNQTVGEITMVSPPTGQKTDSAADELTLREDSVISAMETQGQVATCTVTAGTVSLVNYDADTAVPEQTDRVMALGGAVIHAEAESGQQVIHKETADTVSKIAAVDTAKDFLFEIYPNPSPGEINISYEVTRKGDVLMELYDMNGILLRTLVNMPGQYEGKYIIPADLGVLASGIYICRIINNGREKSTRLIIAK